jgi:hypothetical protein
MKPLHKGLLLVPLFAACVAAPAAAQSWRWDFGVNAGYAHFTNSMGEGNTAIGSASGGSHVKFGDGALVGTQLGLWFNPKLGLRLNGRYSDRPLEGNDMSTDFVTHVNLWAATADLLFRFKAPAPEFTKMEMLPYLALGVGGKWHNGGGDGFTCTEPGKSYNCSPFVTGIPANPKGWALGEENVMAGLIGLGADWRLARSIALRTELSDLLYKPQIHAATAIPAPGGTWSVTGDRVGKITNEIAAQIGLQFLFGVARPPVVAIAPPPAPPPPAPAPVPVVVTREAINVCVVDLTATSGLRTQSAFLVGGRDTVVVVNGADQPFMTTVGTVTVATNADWYVQGRPLTMTIGTGKAEYAVYGTPRIIDANDLNYVGTINGYPVYADRDDIKDINDEINDLNKANAGKDLGEILNAQKNLREAFSNVKVLYVPTTAYGCQFQAVQRQEEVRKGGNK